MRERVKVLNPSVENKLKEREPEKPYDYIKPSHYELYPGMKDTFEIHKSYLTKEEFIGWIKGTILKYKIRIGEKPGEDYKREMDKINVYRQLLHDYLKEE